jgi:hypothetical protein
MDQVQQRFLICIGRMPRLLTPIAAVILASGAAAGAKFYSDDPLVREPAPMRVEKVRPRKLSDIYDLFSHVLATPGEKHTPQRAIRAQDINTLGEVYDGAWYEARHGRRKMTIAELTAGPGENRQPADGTWTVVSAKSEGITPGFMIRDSRGDLFFIKFDPVENPEMATSADVISSKFFYALGYHVPENYTVYFDRDRLEISGDATIRDARGEKRPLSSRDIGEILLRTPREPNGTHRATASRLIAGDILHSFRYYGTRADDPNDIVPHEHRRSLRGLHVFCAWLAHDDSRAINTLDVLVKEGPLQYIKHFLIDFGSTLGSASTKANSPRSGFEQFFTWKSSATEFFTLGLWVPPWARIRYDEIPSVGRFSSQHFDPLKWTPEYPNPAFNNRLPDDIFWAARQVMRFTDDEIRAVVKTGRYSDPAAERLVGDVLIARRDAIGRAYLSNPLSLDNVRIDGSRIVFDDLAQRYGYQKSVEYRYQWHSFDNQSERKETIVAATSAEVPAAALSPILALDIRAAGNESRYVTIYLRRAAAGPSIIGIDRVLN